MPLPLTTERLVLRPFAEDDVPAIHAVYGDPEVMRHVGDGTAADLATTRTMVRAYIERQAADGYSFWAVVERASGEIVGDAGLYPVDVGGPAVELGYTVGRAWWGRGYATEAARACVSFAFDELRLAELVAMVVPENPQSLRVLHKLGFRPAGTRTAYGREHVLLRLAAPAAP